MNKENVDLFGDPIIEAAKKGTNAKNLIESIIECEAVWLAKKDKPK